MNQELGTMAQQNLLKDVRVSPTLVKYADPNQYEISTRKELRHAAAEILAGEKIKTANPVDLLDDEPFEIELATTLLYEHCHYSYRQIRELGKGLTAPRTTEIIDLAAKHRATHNDLLP